MPSTSLTSAITLADDTPAHREQLALPAFDGQVKRRRRRPAHARPGETPIRQRCRKILQTFESYMGAKTTETLIENFLVVISKGLGMVVSIDDLSEL